MLCIRLLFQQQGCIFIAQRSKTTYAPYCWSLVGGRVQHNESALQAAVRKGYEEVGVTIDPVNLILVHTMHRKSANESIVILFFKVLYWHDALINKVPDKYLNTQWCRSLKYLPDNMLPAHTQALTAVEQKIFYSEHNW